MKGGGFAAHKSEDEGIAECWWPRAQAPCCSSERSQSMRCSCCENCLSAQLDCCISNCLNGPNTSYNSLSLLLCRGPPRCRDHRQLPTLPAAADLELFLSARKVAVIHKRVRLLGM